MRLSGTRSRYPPDKRFKLSLRGEVNITDLVAVVGEAGCESILMGPAVASHGGNVSLSVPDLLTAPAARG